MKKHFTFSQLCLCIVKRTKRLHSFSLAAL
jgi:hypothetical protein